MSHFKHLYVVSVLLLIFLASISETKKIKRIKKNKDKDSDSLVIDYSSFNYGFDGNGTGFPTTQSDSANMFQDQASNFNEMGFFPNIDLTNAGNPFNFNTPSGNQGMDIDSPDDLSTKHLKNDPVESGMNDPPVYGTKIKKDTMTNTGNAGDMAFESSMFNFGTTWDMPSQNNENMAKPMPSTYFDDDFKGTIDLTENKDKDQMDFITTDTKSAFQDNERPKNEGSIESKYKDTLRDSKQSNFNYDYSKNSFKNTDLYNTYKDQFKTQDSFANFQDSAFNVLDYTSTTTKEPMKISEFPSSNNGNSGYSSHNFMSNFGDSTFKSSYTNNHNNANTNSYFDSKQPTNFETNFPNYRDSFEQGFTKPDKPKTVFKNYISNNKYKTNWPNYDSDTKPIDKFPSFNYQNDDSNKKNKVHSSSSMKNFYNSEPGTSSPSGSYFSKYSNSMFGDVKDSYGNILNDNKNSYANYLSDTKNKNVFDFTNGKYGGKENIDYSGMDSWYKSKPHTQGFKDNFKDSFASFSTNEPQTTQTSVWFQSPHASYSTSFSSNSANNFQSINNSPVATNHYQNSRPDNSNNEQVVHIKPKKIYKHTHYGKGSGKMTIDDWNREVTSKYKSEEDLLGLRNHDTSHPAYLPSFKFQEDSKRIPNSYDFSGTIEKWRNAKLEQPKPFSYDSFTSESVQQETKPFEIQIPHPVIVPVPQPYPVKVPIPRPVPVPVIRELKIPVEKPVPYPVIKRVPYPVEKPVPVHIEKQVAVPVPKPYPVPIPHIKPIFHTSNSYFKDDIEQMDQDFDNDFVPVLKNTEPLQSASTSVKRYKVKGKRVQTVRARRIPKSSKRGSFYRRQNWRQFPLIKKTITRYEGRSLDDSKSDESSYESLCHKYFGSICNVSEED